MDHQETYKAAAEELGAILDQTFDHMRVNTVVLAEHLLTELFNRGYMIQHVGPIGG
jgi:hypothetical protein